MDNAETREMIIRHFKKQKGREPTEEEIQEDMDFINNVKRKKNEREIIPIIGPYEEKLKENIRKDGFIKV